MGVRVRQCSLLHLPEAIPTPTPAAGTAVSEEEEQTPAERHEALRQDLHELRGSLNTLVLKVEVIYLMLCRLTGRDPRS